MLIENEAMIGQANSTKPRSALSEAAGRIRDYRDSIRKEIACYGQQMDRLIGAEPETPQGSVATGPEKEAQPCDLDALFKSIDELGYTVNLLAEQLSRMARLAG